MIDPKKELFKWGPIDSRPAYISFWNQGFLATGKRFVPWPSYILWIHEEKITFVTEYQQLYDQVELSFKKFILDDQQFKKNYSEWKSLVDEILSFFATVTKKSLAKKSKEELAQSYTQFLKIVCLFWTVGLLPEIANWGGEQLLKRKLQKILSKNNFIRVFERLTAPQDYSFYQDEEIDLFNIKLGKRTLKQHQENFFWMLNSYHHTQVLPVSYFQQRINALSVAEAKKRLKTLQSFPEETKQAKKKIIKKYHLSNEVAKIAQRLSFCIWWQDLRKKYIFMINHQLDLYVDAITVHFKIDAHKLHYYTVEELKILLEKNKQISQEMIKNRLNYFVEIYHQKENSVEHSFGMRCKQKIQPFLKQTFDPAQKKLKRLVVSSGKKVQGKAKIILSPKDFSKMQKNDVLVCPMTAPDYIVAMRKAVAIVTDEGGMTCHAAIVARELGIPCIVATKIATKLLKDNDLVEIDAETGIVKKL